MGGGWWVECGVVLTPHQHTKSNNSSTADRPTHQLRYVWDHYNKLFEKAHVVAEAALPSFELLEVKKVSQLPYPSNLFIMMPVHQPESHI